MATLIGLLGLCAALAGGEAEQLEKDFAAANDRALSGEHAAAIGLYSHLWTRGVRHEDLAYNLGYALAVAKRPVDAVIAFERALWLNPADRDARSNLEQLREQLRPKERTGTQEAVDLPDVLGQLLLHVSGGSARAVAVVAQALFFGFLFWAQKRGRTPAHAVGAILLGAIVLISGGIWAASLIVHNDPIAVPRTKQPLREGPDERFAAPSVLYAGERTRVVREEPGGWCAVRGEAGSEGWVRCRFLVAIDPARTYSGAADLAP